MKIFIEGSIFQHPFAGIAKSTIELYKNVARLDPSIEVIILHKNELKGVLPSELKSMRWGYLKSFHYGRYVPMSLWRALFFPLYVNIHKPDIVHFPWNGLVPRFLFNTKVITSIFDIIPLRIPEYFKNPQSEKHYRKSTQDSINRSDLIITTSNFSRKDIMQEFKLNTEATVIYIGPTINCTQSIGETVNQPYFLYVGGYEKRKGVDKLLETFTRLFKENKIYNKLILTGYQNYYSSYFKDLIDEGARLGFLEEKGYVSESELCFLYSHATALIYPSTYEGFGLPPLEAMKLECPVITTKATSIPEVGGDAVYYVDINNIEEFSQALINLEEDDDLRSKLISLGKNQANKFSWENISKNYLEKIKHLIE